MDDTVVCKALHNPALSMRGFTLIELLVAITILAVLMLSVPSMSSLISRASKEAAQQDIVNILASARAEAIQRKVDVTLCRGSSNTCAGSQTSGDAQWNGSLMFVDTGANRTYESANDELLNYTVFNDALTLTWNRGDSIIFQPDGSVTGNSNGTFSIQSSDGSGACRVILSLQGRARQECD